MTRKELIAEVKSTLKQYDESGLIDDKTLNLTLKNTLKTFGSNIMVMAEKVIDIQNGGADLPEDFWSLELAIKCEQDGYKIEKGSRQNITTNYWKQRIESTYEWDNQANSYDKIDYKEVTERQYFGNDTIVNFRYGGFKPLRLTRGIKKEYLGAKCKNLLLSSKSEYEINILNNKLQTNFSKGFIYMQYNALPTDEKGDLIIPDTAQLVAYLTYKLKRVVLEDIWLNGDDADLVNKISYLTQKEKESEGPARTAVKFEALGNSWDKKLKRSLRKETMVFENMFPNL